MNIYLSEEEQIQKIKEWVKEYGLAVILGIAVFFVGSFGWRYWQQYKSNHVAQASIIYEQLLGAHIAKDYDQVTLEVKHLRDDYAGTPYASLASLIVAQEAVAKPDLASAEQNLQWIIDKDKNASIKQIARIRLSRVLVEEKKMQQALAVLSKVDDTAYLPLLYEMKGDIYLASGDKKSAIQEYKNAEESGADNVNKNVVEMKLNQLLQ